MTSDAGGHWPVVLVDHFEDELILKEVHAGGPRAFETDQIGLVEP